MLPIESIIDSLVDQFQQQSRLVIQAPPGAGKTTRIPIALLQQAKPKGKILLIQPRRLAVYSAARQLAHNLSQAVGNTVGYRTRYDKKVGPNSQIEVITDGLFVNQIQNHSELKDVSVVIFDEFHERSTNMDLGLAFALETQAALRDSDNPLHILVMSATLNGEHLSQWLQAPLLASEGRCFDVQIHYRPPPPNQYLEQQITQLVIQSLHQEAGNILVFLPGMKQIRRLQQQLQQASLDGNVQVLPLHASLPAQAQQQAILPCPKGIRKVVLATNVAETSITIEDVRVVIDSGLARVARYDERRGFNQLVTEPISAASAAQRSGRAGRTQAGICYRLWGESKQASLKAFADPQIVTDDLSPIVLQLARWGVSDPSQLMLLSHPSAEAYQRAQNLLYSLGALQSNYSISEFGRQIANLPLPPRLAALVWHSRGQTFFRDCCFIAALLSEGDPVSQPPELFQADVDLRLNLQSHNDQFAQANRLKQVKKVSQQLQHIAAKTSQPNLPPSNLVIHLAQAFPDRIAKQRQATSKRYQMSNGKGVKLQDNDKLDQHPYLVVLDCDGDPKEPYVRLASSIGSKQLRQALKPQILSQDKVIWDSVKQQVQAQRHETLGQLSLGCENMAKPWSAEIQQQAQLLLLDAIKSEDLQPLPWSNNSKQLLSRLTWLQQQNPEQWPEVSLANLTQQAEHWLLPFLNNMFSFKQLEKLDLDAALLSLIPWGQQQSVDQLAPSHWPLATGRQQQVDYSDPGGPLLSAPMQAFYGLTQHPRLAQGYALRLQLLSPARRPLQITQDIANFWSGSYVQIAKEMRGRYPKHHWPEHPQQAEATEKPKRRQKPN